MTKAYQLIPTKRFIQQLKKLDKFTQKQITNYMSSKVAVAPRSYGKALSANRAGQWRYRIGNYRVIAVIEDDKLVVTALEVGHRRDVYD